MKLVVTVINIAQIGIVDRCISAYIVYNSFNIVEVLSEGIICLKVFSSTQWFGVGNRCSIGGVACCLITCLPEECIERSGKIIFGEGIEEAISQIFAIINLYGC